MTIESRSGYIELDTIRQILNSELEQIKTKGFADKGSYGESSLYGKNEAADATTDFEKRMALDDQKRNHLAAIEYALQKIDAGTYGICDNCGQPIAPARLEAIPHAVYCMSCSAANKKH
jgi:RNA polymerase-binding protein DksA